MADNNIMQVIALLPRTTYEALSGLAHREGLTVPQATALAITYAIVSMSFADFIAEVHKGLKPRIITAKGPLKPKASKDGQP